LEKTWILAIEHYILNSELKISLLLVVLYARCGSEFNGYSKAGPVSNIRMPSKMKGPLSKEWPGIWKRDWMATKMVRQQT